MEGMCLRAAWHARKRARYHTRPTIVSGESSKAVAQILAEETCSWIFSHLFETNPCHTRRRWQLSRSSDTDHETLLVAKWGTWRSSTSPSLLMAFFCRIAPVRGSKRTSEPTCNVQGFVLSIVTRRPSAKERLYRNFFT